MASYKMSGGHSKGSGRKTLIAAGVTLVIGLAVGLLIGRFATCPVDLPESLPNKYDALIKDADLEISGLLIDAIKADNIRENLRILSEHPHLAGTTADYEQAKMLTDFWKEVGLDKTFLTPYNILLSYPDPDVPNRVSIIYDNGTVLYESPDREDILTPGENQSNVVPPFNAYSAPGEIEGDMVYVNYARAEDFYWIKNNASIDVTGKIVIARYGKIFRGDKVNQAERYGAKGIIIFSDPADYTAGDDPKVYPDDWWLPGSGAQRGTVFLGDGDPLTPGYPSTSTAYRVSESNAGLPSIPAHPIGYDIAEKLLDVMGGPQAPESWRGGLNVPYNLGPGFSGGQQLKAKMRISTSNKNVTAYNAFGIIEGAVEPDRYILMGNHRDAWVFGAIDPSSGTAVMMEATRVMGELVKSGKWRPRRTIIFCSWGAEEYGLIGSTEWVEEYAKNLDTRAVAYVNIDIAVQGNFSLRSVGVPLMNDLLYDATARIPNPDESEVTAGRSTVYDTWQHSFPDPTNANLPSISIPGSGSDYAPLMQKIGIPAVDFRYTYDSNTLSIASYPLYHSVYETFFAVDRIIDQGFTRHKAVAQTTVEVLRQLSDNLIIPFGVNVYATEMDKLKNSLFMSFGAILTNNGIELDQLTSAVDNFTSAAQGFENRLKTIDKSNPFVIRMVNDQMMQLDRAFIDPAGLPGRPFTKHILFAPSSVNTYASASFPGLADGLFEIADDPDQDARWDAVRRHYAVIIYTIQSAASTLTQTSEFMLNYA